MKHKYVRITGNKRLSLRNIRTLELTPESRLQMILGSNGSGKSTVMSALSLLPPNPAHYKGGGTQEHIVEHRGSIYEILYDFTGPKNHYSLTKDGKVLYEGHVASACAQYVTENLGITQEAHNICTARQRFSTMRGPERRTLFNKLSPVDYTYALAFYKRLTDAQHGLTEAVKRMSQKVTQEKEKMIDDVKAEAIRKSIAALKLDKDELLKQWTPVNMTVDEALTKMGDVDAQITELSERFFRSIRIYGSRHEFNSLSDLRHRQANYQGKLMFQEERARSLYSQIEENRGIIIKNQFLASQNLEEIDSQINQKTAEIKAIQNTIVYQGYSNNKAALQAILSIFDELTKTISQFTPDPEDEITKANFEELVTQHNRLTGEIDSLKLTIDKAEELIHKFEHATDQDNVHCPKCDHSFNPALNEQQYYREKQALPGYQESHERRRHDQAKLDAKIRDWSEQLKLHQYFFMMLNANKELLAPLWQALLDDRMVKKRPAYAVHIIEVAHRDLTQLVLIDDLTDQLKEQVHIKNMSELSSGVNLKELEHKNASMEAELYQAQTEIGRLKEIVRTLEVIAREWVLQDETMEALERLQINRDHFILKAEEANRKTVINSIMSQLESEILALEKSISQIDSQKAIVQALELDIEVYQRKAKALKKAAIALSPTKGLIAKGMTGFVNHFIEQMNVVISKVWLYPLRISPVEVSEDNGTLDLDYKFTYTYDGNNGAPDISEASGAQQEIFDLAFVLVYMTHKGMEDYPVFLDEFSIKMDYAHRREAMKMVSDLLLGANFSQIFMVSHYEGSYGSLSNADITVLCPENIELPTDLPFNTRANIVHA